MHNPTVNSRHNVNVNVQHLLKWEGSCKCQTPDMLLCCCWYWGWLYCRCWFCWWFCCIIIPSMLNPFCNVELKECKLAVKLCILSMYFSSYFSSWSIILFFNWSSSWPRANIPFSVVVFFVSLEFFFSFSLEIKFLLASTVFSTASLALSSSLAGSFASSSRIYSFPLTKLYLPQLRVYLFFGEYASILTVWKLFWVYFEFITVWISFNEKFL